MSALTRLNPFRTTEWDPVRDLQEFENRLAGFFGRTPVRTNGDKNEAITVAEWAPLVDITEDEKDYVLKAELPGIRKEEVKVSIENGVLSISGERKVEKEEKNKKYHRVERSYGSFARSFALPENVDAEKVSAAYKDGLLTVTVAKSEKAQTKQIEVRVA